MLAVYLSPIYIIANSYLLIRLHRWLGTCNPLFRKTGICVAISLAYVFLVASLLIVFFLPIGPARRIMKLISNYWLGILLYLILAVLMADAICFLLFLITKRRLKCRTAAAGGICAMVVLVLSAWGAYNARIIQVTPYEITVNKDGGRLENLNVVLAADLHLGYNIGTAHMMQMVDIVIDHEPKELQELADAGVDIDLCGHTHDGQMFPANLITALMWENSYGYLKKSEKGPYAYDCDFGCRAFWTEYACRYDCGNQPHHSTFSI